jgi:hypothetical protein
MEILEYTVKDLIKEKHDGEPIIIKFQDPFINASKFINFLGVEILILFTILFTLCCL